MRGRPTYIMPPNCADAVNADSNNTSLTVEIYIFPKNVWDIYEISLEGKFSSSVSAYSKNVMISTNCWTITGLLYLAVFPENSYMAIPPMNPV